MTFLKLGSCCLPRKHDTNFGAIVIVVMRRLIKFSFMGIIPLLLASFATSFSSQVRISPHFYETRRFRTGDLPATNSESELKEEVPQGGEDQEKISAGNVDEWRESGTKKVDTNDGSQRGPPDRELLAAWLAVKSLLPPIVSGAWRKSDGNERPGEALYNLVFVRFPVLCGAAWYTGFVLEGREWYVDLGFGSGPMLVNPAVPFIVIALMLL